MVLKSKENTTHTNVRVRTEEFRRNQVNDEETFVKPITRCLITSFIHVILIEKINGLENLVSKDFFHFVPKYINFLDG